MKEVVKNFTGKVIVETNVGEFEWNFCGPKAEIEKLMKIISKNEIITTGLKLKANVLERENEK